MLKLAPLLRTLAPRGELCPKLSNPFAAISSTSHRAERPCRLRSSNHGERDGEHSGCDQRANRVNGAKREASEIPQRSDSESGNSIVRLIEGDQFSRHRGRV